MQKYIFPFIVFLIGFYLVGLRLVGVDFDGIPGDMGDGRLNNYFLEHGYQYLTGKMDSYWNAPFFYPEKSTMSMSDNLFGTLPLYALFRTMSFDRETAYQIWFLCLLAFNFISCFWVLKKLKISPAAAAIGAYIFAFSLPVVGGIGHIQMLPKFVFPLIMYCLIKLIQEKKSKYLFFFLIFSVYQLYCGIYLGFMSIIASLVVFFVMTVSRGFKNEMKEIAAFLKMKWLSTTSFFLGSITLIFILLKPYISRTGTVERDYGDVGEGLPSLASYFFPTNHSLLYDWMRPVERFLKNSHEHTLWMGLSFVVAVVLGIYLARTKKNKEVKIWLYSFLILILLTLNFYYHVSAYVIIYIIPGFEAVRAVSRIVQLELFFLSGLVAVLVDHYVKPISSPAKSMVLIIGLCSLMVADQFVWDAGLNKHSKASSIQRLDVLKRMIVTNKNYKGSDAFVYLTENDFEVYKYHVDAMLVSQDLGIATVNGYSAFSPPEYESFFAHPNLQNYLVTQRKYKFMYKVFTVKDQGAYLPPQ